MGKIKGIRKLDLTGLNAVDDGKGKVTISLGSSAGAAISIAEGGTGQTTAAAAANALLNTGMTGNALTIGDGGDTITVGDLKVSGGNIKDAGDNQSIQLPGSGNVKTVADLEVAGNDITLGNEDAASTISHTNQGTNDTAGQNMTIKASAGKGNGVGGSIIFQTAKAPGGYGASTQGVHASALTLDQDGDATIANNCVVGGDVVLTGGIKTNGDLLLRIDDNADGANKFTFENGADTEVAQIDESGNLQVDGSLTVGSNIIKASDGGSTISMDTDDNVTILGGLTVNGNEISFDGGHSSLGPPSANSGTNQGGYRMLIKAGQSTGSAAGGPINFYSADGADSAGGSFDATAVNMAVIQVGIAGGTDGGSGHLGIKATNQLHLDGVYGTGDTYITESAADILDIYVGGDKALSLNENTGYIDVDDNWTLRAGAPSHSSLRLKILPTDLFADDGGRPILFDDSGSDRFMKSNSTNKMYAAKEIPRGYKATNVLMQGSGTSAVTVYEADYTSKSVTSKGTGNIGTGIDITDVNSDDTNYILIEMAQTSSEEVYGGHIDISLIT